MLNPESIDGRPGAARLPRSDFHHTTSEVECVELRARSSEHKRKGLPTFLLMALIIAGNNLLSHTLSRAVQSAPAGLKSVTAGLACFERNNTGCIEWRI
jgi:hypothetical protein